jgi:hypothetical protein
MMTEEKPADASGAPSGRVVRDDCAVMVLNYNGESFIRATLDSLLAQTVAPHIVVIDNASTDRSAEIIKMEYPGVELIRNERNYDFGIAYNRAIRQRNEKFVGVLNNDIVAEPDCIGNALVFLESRPDAGAAAFIPFEMGEQVNFPYVRDYIQKKRFGVDLGTRVRFLSKNDPPKPMRYLWGGGTMFKRAVFDVLGFDEEFGWYWEDADLGWMMATRTSFRAYALPGAIVHHMGGASVKKRFDALQINLLDHRNSLLSFMKNATRSELLRAFPQMVYFFLKQPQKRKLWRDMRRKRSAARSISHPMALPF